MQQKNCFFCSFAHKTIIFNIADVFFNTFRSNNQQRHLIQEEPQEEPINEFTYYFFENYLVNLSSTFLKGRKMASQSLQREQFF